MLSSLIPVLKAKHSVGLMLRRKRLLVTAQQGKMGVDCYGPFPSKTAQHPIRKERARLTRTMGMLHFEP